MSAREDEIAAEVPGFAALRVRPPRFGELDVETLLRLAQIAELPRARAVLCDLIADVFDAITLERGEVLEQLLEKVRAGDGELALAAADALAEALELTEVKRGEILLAAGVGLTPCMKLVLDDRGRPVRAWQDGEERPTTCAYGCAGVCVAETGPSLEAERVVREWALCGGLSRFTWPREGGLPAQPAAAVYWFGLLDGLARAALIAPPRVAHRDGGD